MNDQNTPKQEPSDPQLARAMAEHIVAYLSGTATAVGQFADQMKAASLIDAAPYLEDHEGENPANIWAAIMTAAAKLHAVAQAAGRAILEKRKQLDAAVLAAQSPDASMN